MRQRAGMAKGERGAVMIFVLMTILLVGAFTIGVIQVISGDGAGGATARPAARKSAAKTALDGRRHLVCMTFSRAGG